MSEAPPTVLPDEPWDDRNGRGWHRLPDELAKRFTVVSCHPTRGTEADLFHVHDSSGTDLMLKAYHAKDKDRADRVVFAHKLQRLDSTHVVPLLDFGVTEGRYWELCKYFQEESLQRIIDNCSSDFPPSRVVDTIEVLRQLAAALDHMNQAGIVHGDIKPGNILVRSLEPLDIVVGDFGISHYLDEQTAIRGEQGFTALYAAPEAYSRIWSVERDWFSMGMVILVLSSGQHPFAGLDDDLIQSEIASPVPVDTVRDERLRELCRGLLVQDRNHRWGSRQVREWLDGGNPPVWTTAETPLSKSLPVNGREHTSRAEVAGAMADDWDETCRTYLTHVGTRDEPGAGWQLLDDWMAQFGDTQRRVQLVDGIIRQNLPPSVKLAHLLRWLDQTQPPHYRGVRLLPADIPGLAAATAHDPQARSIVSELWEHRLLPVFAGHADADVLAVLDEEWRTRAGWWRDMSPLYRLAGPSGDEGVVRAQLLHSITDLSAESAMQQRVRRRAIGFAISAIAAVAAGITTLAILVSLTSLVWSHIELGYIWLAALGSLLMVTFCEGVLAYTAGWSYPEKSLPIRVRNSWDQSQVWLIRIRQRMHEHPVVAGRVAMVVLPLLIGIFGILLLAVLTAGSWLLLLAIGMAHAAWTLFHLCAPGPLSARS